MQSSIYYITYLFSFFKYSAETKAKEEIEKRDFEIQALRLEVESLKNDLQQVKTRNKKLCEVNDDLFYFDIFLSLSLVSPVKCFKDIYRWTVEQTNLNNSNDLKAFNF